MATYSYAGQTLNDERGLLYTFKSNEHHDSKTVAASEIICLVLSSIPTSSKGRLLFVSDAEVQADGRKIIEEVLLDGDIDSGFVKKYTCTNGLLHRSMQVDHERALFSIFVSTLAGTQQAEKAYSGRLSPFLDAIDVTHTEDLTKIYVSKDAHFITENAQNRIIQPARDGRHSLIILLSGDGGVIDIVHSLHIALDAEPAGRTYQPPTLALIPCGTGNALAHSSGITVDNTLGFSSLARGTPQPLPVFRVTLPAGSYALDGEGKAEQSQGDATSAKIVYGAVVFSWAFHSTLVADSDTPAYRAHGSSRFQMAAKELLFPEQGDMHAWKGTMEYCDTQGNWKTVDRQEHAYVLLTLVSRLEEKFCISPDSKPLDGKMRLVQFGPHHDKGTGVMKLMGAAYDGGKHVSDPHVGYEEVQGLKLTINEEEKRWRRVCIDGKIFVVPQNATITIIKEERKGLELMVLNTDPHADAPTE